MKLAEPSKIVVTVDDGGGCEYGNGRKEASDVHDYRR